MYHFCTYFDSHYLTRGLALYRSLRRHAWPFCLYVLCLDEVTHAALQQLQLPGVQFIRLEDFEQGDTALARAKRDRSQFEYYCTCTPSLPLYVLGHFPEVDLLTYLDADLCFFSNPAPIYKELGTNSILLVGHHFPDHWPQGRSTGIYNVSLLAFRKDSSGMDCLRWWRERCLEWCYYRPEDGKFADQKYLDDWPDRFPRVVMRYLVQGQDYLFNLAGQTSHLDSMRNPCADLDMNCRSQLCILEACRKYNPLVKVIFASTRQVYGKPERLPVDEKHPLRPVDINGINKMAGEWYHLLYSRVHGVRTCALRLTNTIGPRMRVKDARQTFMGVWIRLLVEGRPFEVWDGRQLRDFTCIDDAVQAFLLAALSEEAVGQVFNLGGDCVVSLRQLADLLVEENGRGEYSLCRFPSENERIDIGDYYADFNHIRQVLGWEPKVPLREALRRCLHYYREHLSYYL